MKFEINYPLVGEVYTEEHDATLRRVAGERAECMSKLQDARDSVFTLQQVQKAPSLRALNSRF